MSDAREIFGEMTEEGFRLWTHNPVTKAFFAFLDDQYQNWRELAADLVETGALRPGERAEDANIDVVRGKLSTLNQLRGISLSHIQSFYGLQDEAEEEEPGTHDHDPEGR